MVIYGITILSNSVEFIKSEAKSFLINRRLTCSYAFGIAVLHFNRSLGKKPQPTQYLQVISQTRLHKGVC